MLIMLSVKYTCCFSAVTPTVPSASKAINTSAVGWFGEGERCVDLYSGSGWICSGCWLTVLQFPASDSSQCVYFTLAAQLKWLLIQTTWVWCLLQKRLWGLGATAQRVTQRMIEYAYATWSTQACSLPAAVSLTVPELSNTWD